MNMPENKKILITLSLIVAGLTFFVNKNFASAITRVEKCNALAQDSGSADSRERKVADCLQKLNEEAWAECITKPEDQRGECAENYKNGDASETDNGSGVETPAPITSKQREELTNCKGTPEECLKKNPIMEWTLTAINFFSAGVGVIVTVMIVIGGVQYSAAGGNPQAVQAAKTRIANAIIALLAYFFLFALMQWLIPGGMF